MRLGQNEYKKLNNQVESKSISVVWFIPQIKKMLSAETVPPSIPPEDEPVIALLCPLRPDEYFGMSVTDELKKFSDTPEGLVLLHVNNMKDLREKLSKMGPFIDDDYRIMLFPSQKDDLMKSIPEIAKALARRCCLSVDTIDCSGKNFDHNSKPIMRQAIDIQILIKPNMCPCPCL